MVSISNLLARVGAGLLTLSVLSGCERAADTLVPSETGEGDSGEDSGEVDSGEDSETGDPMVDADGDGFPETEDCDDGHPGINPWAPDIGIDGFDQNCDGVDGTDADGDGFASEPTGGLDCDDRDPTTHPGAVEVWYNGHSEGCIVAPGEDWNDSDQDGDGAVHTIDCDDTDPMKNPLFPERNGNGVDDNCNGQVDGFAFVFDDPEGVDFTREVWFSALALDATRLSIEVRVYDEWYSPDWGVFEGRYDHEHRLVVHDDVPGASDRGVDFTLEDLVMPPGFSGVLRNRHLGVVVAHAPGLGQVYGTDGIGPDCVYWVSGEPVTRTFAAPPNCIEIR